VKTGSGNGWAAQSPYERFFDFIAPDADRFGILLEHVSNFNPNSMVIAIEEKRHFFIFPQSVKIDLASGAFPFRGQNPVVLTAHYDRVPYSPWSNDNSAAVFQLLQAAAQLNAAAQPGKQPPVHSRANKDSANRWMIIFTDKEELQKGEGIQKQGSFSLARKLRSWGLSNARVFNFDACGTGDTLVFSSTADYLMKKNPKYRRVGNMMQLLREKAMETARSLNYDKALAIPTPFSADAGFLRGGIPAQTVTMLPSEEAIRFAALLRSHPGLADAMISGSISNSPIGQLVPETWRCLNGPLDIHLRLTPEHFDKVVRFAVELCK
jgi:hypothetical protein